MPRLSELKWWMPRFHPDISYEENIICLGNDRYVLVNKNDSGPKYYIVDGYGNDALKEFDPNKHPEIDLDNIRTYKIYQQIKLKDMMIEKTIEHFQSVPEYTLIPYYDLDEEVFGEPISIEPATWFYYLNVELEKSMLDVYYRDLKEKANERGMFFVNLDESLLENMDGFDKDERQLVLRKNCSRKVIKTDKQDELIKETFSGHSVHVIYSKKENKISEIRLVENPEPKRKRIYNFRSTDKVSYGKDDCPYKETPFEVAFNNDLGTLKEMVKNGQNINAHDDYFRNSILSAWLDGYYHKKDQDFEETIYRTLNSYSYGDFPPDIICIPLEHRKDGLLEAIEWMLENGLNLNDGYSNDHVIEETPLSVAIENMDYYLTEYLLKHGAGPYEWVWTDLEDREEKDDHLGRIIASGLDESEELVSTAIWLKFAKLLRKYDYTGEFDAGTHYSLIIHDDNDNVEWIQTRFNMF